jgi:hypothetical protein
MCVEGLDSIDALQRYMHKAARNTQVLGRERLASTAQLPGSTALPARRGNHLTHLEDGSDPGAHVRELAEASQCLPPVGIASRSPEGRTRDNSQEEKTTRKRQQTGRDNHKEETTNRKAMVIAKRHGGEVGEREACGESRRRSGGGGGDQESA